MWRRCVRDGTRVLTRHFFRRFIENDLISPDADRHQTLAVVTACTISFSIVVTMILALKYVGGLPTPGEVSLHSLDDKFLYVGWSMAVMALLTLVEWNALALDVRDASILGPLPIEASTIFTAKAAALGMFACGSILVVNLLPTIIFSSAMVSTPLVIVGIPAYFTLLAVHALTMMAAGALGFLGVLGIRELVHALVGTPLFNRMSTLLQAALVVCVVLFLCVLPRMASNVGRVWLAPGHMTYLAPPLWFVGMYEVGAGHIVDDLPRSTVPRRMRPFDLVATQLYRSREPELHRLAAIALIALLVAGGVTASAYTWNNRRLPPAVTAQTNYPHRLRAHFVSAVERLVARQSLVRAGFFFTIHTLWRSGTHRLTMAIAVAMGLAAAILSARERDVLLIQPLVLLVLLTAFRHAARVPGELRANWAFQMCWSGDTAPYMAGVKRAALLCVLAPALLALFPLHVAFLGLPKALLHLLLGVLQANLALNVAMLGFRTLPFASSYSGGTNLKGWMPVLPLLFVLTSALAGLERAALNNRTAGIIWAVLLLAAVPAIRAFGRRQRERYGPVDFYELPGQAQRLDLSV
jgi:hypothetical protein